MGDFRSLIRQTVSDSERKQQEQAILIDAKTVEKAMQDANLLASWVKAEIVSCASRSVFENNGNDSTPYLRRIENTCQRAPQPLGGYSYSTDTDKTDWGNLAVTELIDEKIPQTIHREFADVEVLEFSKKNGFFSSNSDLRWVERFTPSAYYRKFEEFTREILKEDGIELSCLFKVARWSSEKQEKKEQFSVRDLSEPFIITKERNHFVSVYPIMHYSFHF